MNSFHAKIGWKQMRKREIKMIVLFRSVPTRCVIENFKKKKQKNSKNENNTITASFQAKIGLKRLGKRENKKYCSVQFLLDVQQKIPKK